MEVQYPRSDAERLALPTLLTPLVILATGTAYLLFLSSDDHVQAIFQTCIEGSNKLSDIPLIGIPACCLISFFQAALDSRRSAAIMGEILSYVGALLTIAVAEAPRPRSARSWIVLYPTLPWLVFNLAGGAVVWQLAIIPALLLAQRQSPSLEEQALLVAGNGASRPTASHPHNHIGIEEVFAIPVAVIVGYALPCIYLLTHPTPFSIAFWLFFPIYVSLVRQLVRVFVPASIVNRRVHPESERFASLLLYAIPILASVYAHYTLLFEMFTVTDDRSETTRAALSFVQLDFTAIGATIWYWIVLVKGIRCGTISLLYGILLGPGAGLCLAWIEQEKMEQRHISNVSGQSTKGNKTQ